LIVNDLRLDNCSHCACVTCLIGYSVDRAIEELESGALGCWNCEEDEEDPQHLACVVLYERDNVIWDGRCI